MADKLVKQVMHRGAITCTPNTSLHQIIRLMQETGVRAVVVIEEDEALGIVSHMDIVRHYGEDLSRLYARDVMSTELIAISQEAPVNRAIELILKHKVHRLPVVEGKQVIGLISTTDILRDMQQSGLGLIGGL